MTWDFPLQAYIASFPAPHKPCLLSHIMPLFIPPPLPPESVTLAVAEAMSLHKTLVIPRTVLDNIRAQIPLNKNGISTSTTVPTIIHTAHCYKLHRMERYKVGYNEHIIIMHEASPDFPHTQGQHVPADLEHTRLSLGVSVDTTAALLVVRENHLAQAAASFLLKRDVHVHSKR